MSFADRASTLMYNAQSLAATSNSQLRGIIAVLEEMLKDGAYKITASDFNATIPHFEAANIQNVITEVKGYLDGVLLDAAAIDGAVTNNATKAIDKLESMLAGMVPADPDLSLPVRESNVTAGAIEASRAALETARKAQETAIVARFAAMNFPALPGPGLAAIADLRLEVAAKSAEVAAQTLQAEAEQNIRLYTERAQREFDLTSQLVQSWSQLISLTVRMIGQLIADYEQSPMLHAEVMAEQSSALVGAYSGLNHATTALVRSMGDSYKAELAPYRLDVLEDSLKIDAYKKSMELTLSNKTRIASALASALRDAGEVANACIGAVSAHGSFVERSFS